MVGHAEKIMTTGNSLYLPTVFRYAASQIHDVNLTQSFTRVLDQKDTQAKNAILDNYEALRKTHKPYGFKLFIDRTKTSRMYEGLGFTLHDYLNLGKNDRQFDEGITLEGQAYLCRYDRSITMCEEISADLEELGIHHETLVYQVRKPEKGVDVSQNGLFIHDTTLIGKDDNMLRFMAYIMHKGFVDLGRKEARQSLVYQGLLDLAHQAKFGGVVDQIAQELEKDYAPVSPESSVSHVVYG